MKDNWQKITTFLRVTPDVYEGILHGKRVVSGNNKNHFYKVGELVDIFEYLTRQKIVPCTQYNNNCEFLEKAKRSPQFTIKYDAEEEEWISTEEDATDREEYAIDLCGKRRSLCQGYEKVDVTGRECLVKVTEIILQNDIFVKFRFELLDTDSNRSFSMIIPDEEKTVQS